VLAPATLAALPSTRAIPDRDVFYVAHPVRSIQLFRVSAFQFSAQLLTFPTFSLVPLQRFNSSTVQRFNASTLQRFNASTLQRFDDSSAITRN
jgi:hypothetical protein